MTIDYSIIIPAYNEAEFLPRTLESARRAMAQIRPAGEIIVVDNNSTDDTAALAARAGARVVPETINQISRARNAGARAARGRYLVFLDADTLLSTELLDKALALLGGGACCGGGVRVVGDETLPFIPTQLLALWNGISRCCNWAAGCFLFCLREGFEAVNGFSEKVYASEEIWFSRRLRDWGRSRRMQFEIIDDPPIVTSMRKLQWHSLPHMLGYLTLFTLFPPAVRFRRLCRPWYERPAVKR
jgi:glycosyltransferase involved in cell wall biosynthesis